MLKYEMGCEPYYSIDRASTLILNIGVVSNDYQHIFHEHIQIDPHLKIEEYITSIELRSSTKPLRVLVDKYGLTARSNGSPYLSSVSKTSCL